MKSNRRHVVAVSAALLSAALVAGIARAGLLDAISTGDQTSALRTALTQGAQAAVTKLGKADGFLGNPEVRIPLPGKLQKAEKTLRTLGLGKQTDELITAMNRAAEAAVPEAKTLLVDSVKQMTVADAKSILTGGNDAATQYFKRTTSEKLGAKFLPIVKNATAKVDLANRYNAVAGKLTKYGLLSPGDANLEAYVTAKTLDGLYLMMAKEEALIRKDPLGQTSRILQRVFGAAAGTVK